MSESASEVSLSALPAHAARFFGQAPHWHLLAALPAGDAASGARALARLLRHLRGAPEEVEAVRRRMREVLPGQTWQARARQVAIELTGPTGGAVPQPAREGV